VRLVRIRPPNNALEPTARWCSTGPSWRLVPRAGGWETWRGSSWAGSWPWRVAWARHPITSP
jgi:hypothetical protein